MNAETIAGVTAAQFAERLHGKRSGRGKWQAKCPAHDDRVASLSIAEGEEGRVLLKCHAGCTVQEILERAGLTMADLFPPKDFVEPQREAKPQTVFYDYTNADGHLLYQVARFPNKQFRQRRPDGNGSWVWNLDGVQRVPYAMPALLKADLVCIVEGEKDADTLANLHLERYPMFQGRVVATTCNSGGAGKWETRYGELLKGKDIIVCEDNDDAGRKHTLSILRSVYPHARSVKLISFSELPAKSDVSDFLREHSVNELLAKIGGTPHWQPEPDAVVSGYKLIPLIELMNRPDEPVDYLLEGRLVAGTVSVFVAKPKVGKSTLARNLALAVSTGRDFLGCRTRQGEVIYLALEERPEDVKADFVAMGATGREPIHIHAASAPEDAMLALVELVRERKPALVMIDPLFRLTRVRDEKAYAEIYNALGPLIDLARETGTHIVLTHHAGKSLKADAIDSPLGSTALGGIVATLVVIKRGEGYRTIETVQRIGVDLPETVLHFDSATRTLSLGGSKAETEQADAERRILDYLRQAGEPKTQAQIREEVEGATKILWAALTELVKAKRVSKSGEGKRGKPFLFSCSQHISGTREQETENGPETRVNIDEKVVPEKSQNAFLVLERERGEF